MRTLVAIVAVASLLMALGGCAAKEPESKLTPDKEAKINQPGGPKAAPVGQAGGGAVAQPN